MSKKKPTQWDRVPKDQRGKLIRQGIVAAFIGFLGFIPNMPKDETRSKKHIDKG